jgi:hypothetical protein
VVYDRRRRVSEEKIYFSVGIEFIVEWLWSDVGFFEWSEEV